MDYGAIKSFNSQPHARLTCSSLASMRFRSSFNSQPHARLTTWEKFVGAVGRFFQFTASCEADLCIGCRYGFCYTFNSQPHARLTLLFPIGRSSSFSFNSQPHARLTKLSLLILIPVEVFQFTASCEADPLFAFPILRKLILSIHSLMRG